MKLLAEPPLEETKSRTYSLLCPCHKLIAQSQISIGKPVSQRIWTPRGFGPPGPYLLADLDTPGPNPLAVMDPPLQIWTPIPNFSFKHPLYHIW